MNNFVHDRIASRESQGDTRDAICVACGLPTRVIAAIEGYVRGPRFMVTECESCATQGVSPQEVPPGLYDAIYAHADRIDGGYDRYLRYADQITSQRDPIGWLATQEDMYWGVRQFLSQSRVAPALQVIEVGCGLGYLTYALSRDGYRAHGIDISAAAVHGARERFGNLYTVEDAATSGRMRHADVVLALELIEHLPDPAAFLKALRATMAVDAAIIVSTPNRDIYPADVIWNTDLPPVHFHWFSERGLYSLARGCGFATEFTDFTGRHLAAPMRPWLATAKFRRPRFDESLRPIEIRRTTKTRRSLVVRAASRMARAAMRATWFTHRKELPPLKGNQSVTLVARLTPCLT